MSENIESSPSTEPSIEFVLYITTSQYRKLNRQRYFARSRLAMLMAVFVVPLTLYQAYTVMPVLDGEQLVGHPFWTTTQIVFWGGFAIFLPASLLFGYRVHQKFLEIYWKSFAGFATEYRSTIKLTQYSFTQEDSQGVCMHYTGAIGLTRSDKAWKITINGMHDQEFFIATISPDADQALRQFMEQLNNRPHPPLAR